MELLKKIIQSFPKALCLIDYQLYFYIVIAFFGFLRFDDVKRLQLKHFTKQGNAGQNLTITIPSSKADQFKAGSEVYISCLPNDLVLCPVKVSFMYFEFLKCLGSTKSSPVLPASCTRIDKVISASTLTRRLRLALVGLVPNANTFTLHSFRSGGATAAANAKVPKALIASHGRWKSDAVNCYIRQNDESKLSVSKAIASTL
jgi:hypothetical protein